METEEIYSFTIYPPVTSTFAVEWSEDDHISVLTEKGIKIFEVIPSPMSPQSTVKFSRSFIYPPQILPTEGISSKVESKIWSMHREALYSFMMDETLTPKLSNVKEMTAKIVDLAWSPADLLHPSKCLLAILTSAGAVMILYKISTDWYPAYDLSSVRNNSMEPEIYKSLKENEHKLLNFETLKNHIQKLRPSCFTWSKFFKDFAHFAIAYQNGDVIIYKIPRITDYNEKQSPEIVGTVQLNEYVKINTLHWITIVPGLEHLIIVGYFDGRIYGMKLEERDERFQLKFIEKYYDYKDRLSVTAIKIFPRCDHDVKVLIVKGSFLSLLRFTETGTLKSIEHLQLEGFMVSGIICISADCALVATENSIIYSIDTKGEKFLKTKINNKLSQVRVRYLGLAQSQSSVIFLNITSPSTIYDHLVVKEPTKVCMFGLNDKSWDPLFVLENKREKSERLAKVWDCLEAIRLKATRASDPSVVLPKIPSNYEYLSFNELQIAMWLSVIVDTCERKKVIQGIGGIASDLWEAQPLIFVHSACNYLMRILNKSNLLEEQKLSIRSLTMYLKKYLEGKGKDKVSSLYRLANDVLNKAIKLCSTNVETCNLCGEVINGLAWEASKCPQGHLLPRCSITLLQVTSVQYRTCPICRLIFHSSLDQEFKETRCLFCDVPVLQENRVLNAKCYIPKEKSLSRARVTATEAEEDREMEAVSNDT